MTVLLDEDGYAAPTFMNIIESFKKVSEESIPGDAVFVQFSGHGGRVLDAAVDSDAESYDEIICPADYKQTGLIRDTLIFKTLLAPMRFGVTVTILLDCCDTGMLLELPYSWSAKSDRKDIVAKVRHMVSCLPFFFHIQIRSPNDSTCTILNCSSRQTMNSVLYDF
jgi:Caspase domain